MDSSIHFFSIIEGSRLQHSDVVIDPQLPWQRLRIIGLQRKAWHLDPMVEHTQDWRFWIWEGRPLSEVEWDPKEWHWPPLDISENPIPFFSYNARTGRQALGALQRRIPTQAQRWYAQGISLVFLRSFWKTLWASWRPRKISYFLWMVAHKGLPVGSWLRQMGHEGQCQMCLQAEETLKHCLWRCLQA